MAFTSDAHGLVFQAPLQQVRARFPKLYFGIGAKLAVDDKAYRLWFVRLQSMRGQIDRDAEGVEGVVLSGNRFLLSDVGPARAAVRQWQAALSQPGPAG